MTEVQNLTPRILVGFHVLERYVVNAATYSSSDLLVRKLLPWAVHFTLYSCKLSMTQNKESLGKPGVGWFD